MAERTAVGVRRRPSAAGTQSCRSTSRRSARTSRSCPGPSATTSRWSTWTRARPRSSPMQVLDAEREYYERHNARRAPRRAPARRGGHRDLRGRAGEGRRVHRRRTTARSCSPRARPRRSTWSPSRSPARSGPATRSSSPRSSTTPTWCPWQQLAAAHRRDAALVHGAARRPARRGPVADHRPDQDRRGDRPVERHRRDPAGRARSPSWRTRRARWCSCDGAQLVPHHPVDVEGARTWTSWPSPGTRCSARSGSACCTASTPRSTRCRRSSPAGR